MAIQQKQTLAVFDFDKTIISCDSAFYFIKSLILESPARWLTAFVISPFVLALLLMGVDRKYCVSAFFWIGTVWRTGSEVDRALDRFVEDIFKKPVLATVFKDAVQQIESHLNSGCRVLILSASPQILVEKLIAHSISRSKEINVLGTVIKKYAGGMIYETYCYHVAKIKIADEKGYDKYLWTYGYSDSSSDIPILRRCSHRFAVNPIKKSIQKFNESFGSGYTIVHWD